MFPDIKDILAILDKWPAWKRITGAPKRIDGLEERIAQLEEMLQARPSKFVESHGALFKRKADGSFEKVVYCPNCKTNAVSVGLPQFDCGQCGWVSAFTVADLPVILAELERSQD